MMMRRWITLLALVTCMAAALRAQNLRLKVTDAESGELLPGVTLSCLQGQALGVTDALGEFTGTAPCDTVLAEFLGYEPRMVLANGKPQQVTLSLSPIELAPTVITDGAHPVVEDPQLHVVDYNFADGWLVMLTVNNKTRKRELLWSLPDGSRPGSLKDFQESPQGFATDCMGNTYMLSASYAYEMRFSRGRLTLSPLLRQDYEEYLTACQASLGPAHFYKFQKTLQLMHFIYTPKPDAAPQLLTSIADTHARAVLGDNRLMVRKRLGDKVGLDPNGGFHTELNRLYIKHIEAAPIDIPMHTLGGLVRLFDHANGYIHSYDAQGIRQELVKIHYHEQKQWEPVIIPCPERQMAYTLYLRGGSHRLMAIDLATGATTEGAVLPHPFPEQVRVRDGWVFYLYQDATYDPVKRLFRMRID